ncbi:MAG TPA: glycosyltransferase family 4 protein [Armatimonadota bacterium]|nr:glycosyltransferase family 4 protein [Armatimonadota bacterium]
MRVVSVNYYYDSDLATPEDLLRRYGTLVGWAEGLAAAGVESVVVQRFKANIRRSIGAVEYHFVNERGAGARSPELHSVIASLRPDVVHVNGMSFAPQARRLKSLLSGAPIVIQDHADRRPSNPFARTALRLSLRQMDAVIFTAREQSLPWLSQGLLSPETPVLELMEGSSRFSLLPRHEARAQIRMDGDPLCLWVGRLDPNKDPLTVLDGFAMALQDRPRARLAMIYGEAPLLPQVLSWLRSRPGVARCVTLIGPRPHAELEAFYNSADLFLLGSHHEGSGYAALEAISCGAVPILTDIPSFRRLTDNGRWGGLWRVGDAASLAHTLVDWESRLAADTRVQIRRFFEDRFTFEAIGRRAVSAYQTLIPRTASAQIPLTSLRRPGEFV